MPTIKLKTAIPGTKSLALGERRDAAVPRGLSHATPVYVARAEGAMLEDVDGNRFIDFAGGIGCINIGHRSPGVLEAIEKQAERFLHACIQVTPYESYIRLAERLNELTPGDFPKKTLLVSSGAEAIENAVKVARAYTGRPGIIAFEDAFHGRTMMTLALTSKTHPYKAGFQPFPGEVYRIPFAYCYRCSYSLEYPSCDLYCARHLEDTFTRVVAAEGVAAVIAEPVLGEGGFGTPPQGYFRVLLEVCRKNKVLFIADEIQTGFGRTGALFACDRYGIEPDLIATAKSLGGGLPIAAITGRSEVMDAPIPGGLGGTFAGNPVSCEAALAVLDLFADDKLNRRANELGEHFQRRAREWQKLWPIIGEVRGLGAMQALELVRSRETREPAPDETKKIAQYCYEHGVITISAGSYGNVIRLLMRLVITEQQMDEALDILQSALQSVCETRQQVAESVVGR